ncbi:Fe-S cluster assembly protein SufD [Agriterribacter sp.]|uniref:Fe-S cluster assembly protein SufD n=1 Tax=Agriterribacter sp. TaxID=2821509 RepID=UPI002C5EFAFB|nr:Fe-S cluster assembly protein SufD [Agriterribacter sp.]HRO46420.1 Fe-S cluster assembly protein SufD [Agriterribacter sp.]HRQ17608.1 Fe-S cluster assembly protein SufD [Agriterribacter sp.]
MITTTSLYDQFITLYREKETAQDNNWLKPLRDSAFEAFSGKGFPTTKLEEWRFTNVSPFLKEDFRLQPGAASLHKLHSAVQIPLLDAYEVVLKNGMLNEDVSIPGVKVLPLRTALKNDDLKAYLGQRINLQKHPFAALNTALFENGIVIEAEKNSVCDKPIHITHVYNAEEAVFIQPRILIIAHRSSKIQIVESVVVIGDKPLFVNSVTECYVAENAQADQYNLQIAPSNAHLVNFNQTVQQSNSLYNNHTYILPDASFVRNNLHLDLNGTNTESHLYGLYLAGARQLADNHTTVNHLFPNCLSNELYKGVLLDSSRCVFSGRIFVDQDAQKTNAFQQNNNMLLSNKAVVDSKPQLEIFADDVKCSHGSTVGSLNKEALFYLQSRGIGETAARNLMVKAFAFDVTNKIQIPAVREYVEKLITRKMAEAYD